MIHLLFQYARRIGLEDRRVLTEQELTSAGVHCDPDTRQLLEDAGVVTRTGDEYKLAKPVRTIVGRFTVAKGPRDGIEIRGEIRSPRSANWMRTLEFAIWERAQTSALRKHL
jgi:hypothetical protein